MAVSGGADSTALLRGLLDWRAELGIVVSVLHVEHGLRGAGSHRDAAFVNALAEEFNLPCEVIAVDTPKRAVEGKESIEEAARNLRYQVFREVLTGGKADKIATGHTLDDQAETVLLKLLRGAWTEGLSGIHPVLEMGAGSPPLLCIRPLLAVTRAEIEAYLERLGQTWCDDETNRSLDYSRNLVRHELLPVLRKYNPRIVEALAHVAANARAEQQHWQGELARVLPQLMLRGKPVRGGGRSVGTGPGSRTLALDVERLRALDAGLRRRVVRATAERCGATLDFETTERLLDMIERGPRLGAGSGAGRGRVAGAAKRLELAGGVRAERSARELQFEQVSAGRKQPAADRESAAVEYALPVPGTVEAPLFGAVYEATVQEARVGDATVCQVSAEGEGPLPNACVRAWRAGDRVDLAHSGGPKKVKEVLERLGIRGEERVLWPVIVWQGRIIWMRGVKLAVAGNGNSTSERDDKGPAVREKALGVSSAAIRIKEARN